MDLRACGVFASSSLRKKTHPQTGCEIKPYPLAQRRYFGCKQPKRRRTAFLTKLYLFAILPFSSREPPCLRCFSKLFSTQKKHAPSNGVRVFWRREEDLNLRLRSRNTRFPIVLLKPLRHLCICQALIILLYFS